MARFDYTKPIPFLQPTKVTWLVFVPLVATFFVAVYYYNEFFVKLLVVVAGEDYSKFEAVPDPVGVGIDPVTYTWGILTTTHFVASYVLASFISLVWFKIFPRA